MKQNPKAKPAKDCKEQKAQLTLEYLILLGAILSAFAFITPQIAKFYNAAVFAIDSRNAEILAEKIAGNAEKLSMFEESSIESIKAKPNLKWKLSIEGNKINVLVESKGMEKEKEISRQAKAELEAFEGVFVKEFRLGMKKESGKILVQERQN